MSIIDKIYYNGDPCELIGDALLIGNNSGNTRIKDLPDEATDVVTNASIACDDTSNGTRRMTFATLRDKLFGDNFAISLPTTGTINTNLRTAITNLNWNDVILNNTTLGMKNVLTKILTAVRTLQTNLAGLAPVASPTFTGIPKAPTATAGTATTQIATTAFVNNAIHKAPTLINSTVYSATEVSTTYRLITFSALANYNLVAVSVSVNNTVMWALFPRGVNQQVQLVDASGATRRIRGTAIVDWPNNAIGIRCVEDSGDNQRPDVCSFRYVYGIL